MLSIKVDYVVPLNDMQLLVFFENGVVKKFDVKPIMKDYPEFEAKAIAHTTAHMWSSSSWSVKVAGHMSNVGELRLFLQRCNLLL